MAMDVADKRPEAAMARLKQALSTKPNDADILNLAGRLDSSLGNDAGAERNFRASIEANPRNIDGYVLLAQLYTNQKKTDAAVAEFQKLAERQPKSVATQTAIGTLYMQQGNHDKAIEAFERAVAIDSRAAVAANNLAYLYAERGVNLDVALKLAQTAKSLFPKRHEVNDTLGWVYVKKALPELALPLLRESVAAAPKMAAYHYHLGVAYAGSDRPREARLSLERALTLQDNFTGADAARKMLSDLSRR
jgi:tetratricopeptide (TPR) repeat protein